MSKTDNSFVVVSDFHSHEWPLDKVENHYINVYGKVYILEEANYSYITKDENARKIAMKIGIQNIN